MQAKQRDKVSQHQKGGRVKLKTKKKNTNMRTKEAQEAKSEMQA